jgi:multidrug efflux pump subunit AcrA (membrane-fusion protein)
MRLQRNKLIFGLFIVVFFMVLASCSLFPAEEETLAPPLVEPGEISYRTAQATIGYIEDSIKKTAYFVPVLDRDHFFSARAGRLKAIHVKPGDTVKAGDIIAELLTDGIEKEIEYQKLTVDTQLKSLRYIEQKSEIDIQAAQKRLTDLEEKYDEMKRNSSVYTANDIENMKQEMESQKFSLDKLILDYTNQLDMKQNELMSAQMKLAQLEEDLVQCRLVATVDGTVTYARDVDEGDSIDIYQTLVTISDPRVLQLEYKGNQASDFRLGMEVAVTCNKQTCKGEVVLTPASVPFEEMEKYKDTILIKLSELPEGVERGDSAEIKLVRDFSENAVIIPKRALKSYLGKDIVYILDDGIRIERYVQKGVQSVNEVEIIEGVEAGELVIIE